MTNELYLRRKNKIIINKGHNDLPNVYITSILKNIEDLGFTFSKDLIKVLKTLSISQITEFYSVLVINLKKMVGANVRYRPMYPNFPEQVMEMNESELYFNAIIHYITFGKLLPDYEHKEKFPLLDECRLKIIDIGNEEDFINIFKGLLNSKTSISDTDKQDIEWFVKEYKNNIISILPEQIPLKENVGLVSKLLLQYVDNSTSILYKYFKTATDVLRLAVALSDGDISLADNTYFKSFKRKERRLLLSLLENCNNIEEDMLRHKGKWIRLGERLHPSEYKNNYLKSQTAFYKLRNNEKIETFGGKTEELFQKGNYGDLLNHLKQRPSEFARKLDYILRNCSNSNIVLNEFKDVAKKISSTVLLQVVAHFKNRDLQEDIRTFFPKGNIAKVHVEENNLADINKRICDSVVKICENALVDIFKEKDFLGNVYLDNKLKNYLVPFSQRSSSKTFKTVVRGSKIDIDENTNTIRSFVYWKQSEYDRVDLDLSAVMYDKDWNYVEHISYTNLRSNKYKACHSGDITSAPNGATEFIDLDIDSVRKYGGRYIVICVNSYTDQPFSEIPECFMGWMVRQYPKSGEIYEPKTVQNKIDITSESKICIPMILDLQENKVIWADLSLKSNPNWYNNIEGNKKGITLMGKAISNLIKPTLYDLFELHVKARGIVCDDINKADVVFSEHQGITPYDYEKIISEFL